MNIRLITSMLALLIVPVSSWAVETDYDLVDDLQSQHQTYIKVNIPSKTLRLYHEGELVHKFPVAVGQPRFKTPVGPKTMTNIVWNPWWIPPSSGWAKDDVKTPPGPRNPLGPVKMRLGSSILLHGTSNENTVGQAASHGCMRMYNRDAQTLAWWIQQRYSDQADPSLRDEYASNGGRSYHVNLKEEVPVDITYELFEIEDGLLKIYPDVYWKVQNKKEEAMNFLISKGFSSMDIDQKKLDKVIEEAKKQPMQIALKKIYHGKVASAYSVVLH